MELLKIGAIIDNEPLLNDHREEILSPADGHLVGHLYKSNIEDVKHAIDSAESAFYGTWQSFTLRERKKLLLRLYERVLSKTDIYARLEAENTGRTIRQSTLMDVPVAVDHIHYFATEGQFKSKRRITHPDYPGTKGEVQYAPYGVVAAIAPWNVPFLMAVWKTIPALLAGNTVVLKPSLHTPATAYELVKDMVESGFPRGVVNLVIGSGREIGDELVSNRKVRMVSFTGSTKTGKEIMKTSASGVRKVVLELGGKSPTIVFDDCDLKKTVNGVLFSIFLHMGQICEAGSRLIIQNSIKDKFLSLLRRGIEAMKDGNPMDMETDIGAITTSDQLSKIRSMVERGTQEGSKIYYSKKLRNVPENGLFYPPTILDNVSTNMSVYREEIFGPVLSVIGFNTEREAVEIANDTRYGLAASVWTRNTTKARRVGSRIEAGTIWINQHHLPSAAAPRGGFKDSGVGRELGLEGLMEYTQTRHLFINDRGIEFDDIAPALVVSNQEFFEDL